MEYTITELCIYPVKSLGGFSVESTMLSEMGLEYDRRWMLIDENNRFLSQREFHQLALFQTEILNETLSVYLKENRDDSISLLIDSDRKNSINVKIWDDECEAVLVDEIVDQWFSKKLGSNVRLVYMPDSTRRIVDKKYTKEEEITGFSDGYPILLIGQSSLDDLNSKLESAVSMERFRPNIVFSGGQPFDEDGFKHFQINGIDMYGVKLCARCVMTTIDQQTGISGKEPLATLSSYRLHGNKVHFGQNVIFHGEGKISVGDKIHLKS